MRDKVRQYILENFLFGEDDGKLEDNDSLLEKGVMDSTGVLELMMFIEENFEISIEDEELIPENLDSINNITSFIDRKQVDKPKELS